MAMRSSYSKRLSTNALVWSYKFTIVRMIQITVAMAEFTDAFLVDHMGVQSRTKVKVEAMDAPPPGEAVSVFEPWGFQAVASLSRAGVR